MKPYSLILNIVLKSGVQKKYKTYTSEAMTKKDAQEALDAFKNIIETICKGDATGVLTLKVDNGKEVLINSSEIALVEFEIVEC